MEASALKSLTAESFSVVFLYGALFMHLCSLSFTLAECGVFCRAHELWMLYLVGSLTQAVIFLLVLVLGFAVLLFGVANTDRSYCLYGIFIMVLPRHVFRGKLNRFYSAFLLLFFLVNILMLSIAYSPGVFIWADHSEQCSALLECQSAQESFSFSQQSILLLTTVMGSSLLCFDCIFFQIMHRHRKITITTDPELRILIEPVAQRLPQLPF